MGAKRRSIITNTWHPRKGSSTGLVLSSDEEKQESNRFSRTNLDDSIRKHGGNLALIAQDIEASIAIGKPPSLPMIDWLRLKARKSTEIQKILHSLFEKV